MKATISEFSFGFAVTHEIIKELFLTASVRLK